MEAFKLKDKDFPRILAFLDGLHMQRRFDTLGSYILTSLPTLFSVDLTAYSTVEPSTVLFDYHAKPWGNSQTHNAAAFIEDNIWTGRLVLREHPLVRYYLQTGRSEPHAFSDFLTQQQFHRTDMYDVWYRTIGLEDVLGIVFPVPGKQLFQIVVGRGRHFDDYDKVLMSTVTKHLQYAYRNVWTLTGYHDQTYRSPVQINEDTDVAVIVVGHQWRIEFATSRANQWLDDFFEPRRSIDRLPDSLERWAKAAQQKSRAAVVVPVAEPLTIDRQGRRLSVKCLPEPDRWLLLFERHRIDLSLMELTDVGLSKREREVLSLLTAGKSSRQLSEVLGISTRTVKKHLEHIYRKLGVDSRDGAITLARRIDREA